MPKVEDIIREAIEEYFDEPHPGLTPDEFQQKLREDEQRRAELQRSIDALVEQNRLARTRK